MSVIAPTGNLRHMAKAKKMTKAVLGQIPALLDRGLSPTEIAQLCGCTLGTLRVVCSNAKISLRRKSLSKPRAHETAPHLAGRNAACSWHDGYKPITIQLPVATADLLRQRANEKGLAPSTLATTLLEVIIQDKLYDAVLDDRDLLTNRAA